MKFLTDLFTPSPVDLEPRELIVDDFRPATELETFAMRTRQIVTGLDVQISDLDLQITQAIARLNDLKKIRTSQQLALNFMEDQT